MSESNADKLAAVLKGEPRYGIELDAALRTIGQTFPGTVCLEWFASIDDAAPLFRDNVLAMLEEARKTERLYEFRCATPNELQEGEFKIAVRIRFSSTDAAYYQFALFPPQLDYVSGWARKRDGDSQVILLSLRSRECLDDFIAVCRRNPHFVSIDTITEEEFERAPSNAV